MFKLKLEWNELTHASSRDHEVAEPPPVDGVEVVGEAVEELAVAVPVPVAVAEAVDPPAQAPSPILVVVLVPGTTHRPPSARFDFLTVRFVFGLGA